MIANLINGCVSVARKINLMVELPRDMPQIHVPMQRGSFEIGLTKARLGDGHGLVQIIIPTQKGLSLR